MSSLALLMCLSQIIQWQARPFIRSLQNRVEDISKDGFPISKKIFSNISFNGKGGIFSFWSVVVIVHVYSDIFFKGSWRGVLFGWLLHYPREFRTRNWYKRKVELFRWLLPYPREFRTRIWYKREVEFEIRLLERNYSNRIIWITFPLCIFQYLVIN